MNIGKLKRSTQIAIMTGVGSGAVEKTVTGTAPLTLSDSVAGNIRSITVKGHSAVNEESIISVGEGYGSFKINDFQWSRFQWQTVYFFKSNTTIPNIKIPTDDNTIANISASFYKSETANNVLKPNYDGCISCGVDGHIYLQDNRYDNETDFINNVGDIAVVYQQATPTSNTLAIKTDNGTGIDGIMTVVTTGLPLRSTLDGTVYDELTTTHVITRCGLVNNEVVPLAIPVETPLSSSEIAALTALSTYDPTTVISVTDNPSITVKYMGKNITRTAPKKRSSRKKKV